jgi:pimeloyl-ACP methyl ester carboxylesterase
MQVCSLIPNSPLLTFLKEIHFPYMPLSSFKAAWFGFATLSLLYCSGCATAPSNPNREARHLLRSALVHQRNPSETAGLYLAAAETSLTLSTDRTSSAQTRTEAITLYNRAVAGCVISLKKLSKCLPSSQKITLKSAGKTYQIRNLTWGDVDRFIDSEEIPWKQMKHAVRRYGMGGTLVALQNNPATACPNRPLTGFAQPLTAIASFEKTTTGATAVSLSLLDPRKKDFVMLHKERFPLSGDFTAPLAYFPKNDGVLFGLLSMIQSDRVAQRQGIYFCEPYNPEKIPLLLVHGLASAPAAWLEFANHLNESPEFRRRYQLWVYLYPSGGPIVINALRLRTAIADIATRYPLHHKIILMGHSMGGILSRLQVTNASNTLWKALFGAQADAMQQQFPDDSLLKRALFFQSSPYISRVIFIATPHRGSVLATLRLASIPSRLIRMPRNLLKKFDNQLQSALHLISPSQKYLPTGISGLSPKSPLLQAMNKTTPSVPCHSIIGNRGLDIIPRAESSDGIVPYWSSHLDAAQSELIVPTGHDAFNSPASVTEVLRILQLQE